MSFIKSSPLKALVTAAALTASLLASPERAHAAGPAKSTGKGIVGGILLGGEVVVIPMGAAGLSKGWPYLVFGGVGMVGGGIGGYFVEKTTGTKTPEAPTYMMAFGFAFVIPALVLSLNATAYKPPETDRQEPSKDDPAKDPAKPVKIINAKASPAPHAPLALIDSYKGKISLGVPALEVKPLYTQQEIAQFGVEQGSEVKIPLFKAAF